MKKILTCAIVLLSLCSLCFAGPFDAQDTEATTIALFVKGLLGEDTMVTLRDTYPNASFTWGGRLMGIDESAVTWIVFCEAREGEQVMGYYYWELKLSNVNADSDLAAKYNIPLE